MEDKDENHKTNLFSGLKKKGLRTKLSINKQHKNEQPILRA